MQRVRSFDGTTLALLDEGSGPAVVLLHGFAADHRVNWVAPGVVAALVASGRRVIAPDARGHGASDKPTDPARYADDAMVRDVQTILDQLAITDVDVVGYSMGSMTASRLVPHEPRARSLILGGIGGAAASGPPPANGPRIAAALLADDPSTITDPVGKAFREFADRTGADRQALAALQQARRGRRLGTITTIAVPTLVLVGDRDALLGSPEDLAARIPGAEVQIIPGDHLSAVVGPAFRGAIVDFLDRHPRP